MTQRVTRDQLPVFRFGRRQSWRMSSLRLVAVCLILGGLVMAGFVGYELWMTDVIARSGQGQLTEALAARAATATPEARPYRAETLAEAPIPLPAGIELAAESPEVPSGEIGSDPPAVASIDVLPGEDWSAFPLSAPVVMTEAVPSTGGALGRIVIPAAGVEWTVVEGVGPAQLRTGAGHMPGTALPGEPGNAVISGHRTTYGAPFADLDRLESGDQITVQTAAGTHTYAVVESRIVQPGDLWVTGQWRGAWLTLTTCHPRYSSAQRLVVFAHLVAGPNAEVILASS